MADNKDQDPSGLNPYANYGVGPGGAGGYLYANPAVAGVANSGTASPSNSPAPSSPLLSHQQHYGNQFYAAATAAAGGGGIPTAALLQAAAAARAYNPNALTAAAANQILLGTKLQQQVFSGALNHAFNSTAALLPYQQQLALNGLNPTTSAALTATQAAALTGVGAGMNLANVDRANIGMGVNGLGLNAAGLLGAFGAGAGGAGGSPALANANINANLGMGGGAGGAGANVITTFASIPGAINSPHVQKQLEKATISRQASTPHHHARTALAQARSKALQGKGAAAAAAAAAAGGGGLSNARMVGVGDENLPGSAMGSQANLEPFPVNGKNNDKGGVDGLEVAAAVAGSTSNSKSSEWTSIDLGGMSIKNLSAELYRYTFLTSLYLNHNHLSHLSSDIAKLNHLTTLDVSGNKLSSVPSELGLVTSLKELLLFDNQLTMLPPELGFLCQLDLLGIEGNPLAEPIMSIMQKDGTNGVITYLRDNCPVGAAPQEREWIAFEEDVAMNSSDVFTLFCYNILCERYASPSTYAYTPSWALNWEYRRDQILQEILNYNADIVCLQEVELGQYDDYFKEQFGMAEYEGVFYPKSRARSMDDYGRRQTDGCATFFRTSRFQLLEKHVIEFQQIAMQRPEYRKNEDIFNRIMIKDNIAVLTLLENKDTRQRILVANAHLHWDPQYRDVKLLQTAMLMDEIQRLLPHYNASTPSTPPFNPNFSSANIKPNSLPKLPVLVCGDFNSTPDSGVYHFINNGAIPDDHEDMSPPPVSSSSTTTRSSLMSVYPQGLVHRVPLKSAYSLLDELDFTNWTPTFTGVIDYIWYDTKLMNIVGLLGNVDRDYKNRNVGFPNWHHPSDHIPLLAQIRLLDDKSKRSGGNSGSHSNSNSGSNSSGNPGSFLLGQQQGPMQVQGVMSNLVASVATGNKMGGGRFR